MKIVRIVWLVMGIGCVFLGMPIEQSLICFAMGEIIQTRIDISELKSYNQSNKEEKL